MNNIENNNTIKSIYNAMPLGIQNLMVSVKGFFIRRQRYGKVFERKLQFIKDTEKKSETEITEYRLRKANQIIEYAVRNVPFYKSLHNEGEIPKKLNSIEEIKSFPKVTKKFVKNNWSRFVTNRKKDIHTAITTSGTTGSPLTVPVTKEGLMSNFLMAWRQREKNGLTFRERPTTATFNGRLIVPKNQSEPPYWRNNYSLNQTLFSEYHISEETVDYYQKKLSNTNYKIWVGYPSFIGIVAKLSLAKELNINEGPQVIQFTSENLTDEMKTTVNKFTRSKIIERYSMAERCASMSSCSEHRMHVDRMHSIVEFDKSEVEEKGKAEIIGTTLLNKAMPLIRYKTGDIATVDNRKCPCSISSKSVPKIDGRKEDYIVTPSGEYIGRLDHVFKGVDNIIEAKVIQVKIDKIEIRIVPTVNFSARDENIVRTEILRRVGEEIRMEFTYHEKLDRTKNGKLRAVVRKGVGGDN